MHISSPSPPSMNQALSHWIDLFRWVGAFSVVLAHAGNRFLLPIRQIPREEQTITQYLYGFAQGFSHSGIMLFFVISGFLVGGTAWREAARSGTIDLPRFMRRRLIRLWIVLIPALFITWAFDVVGIAQGGVAAEIYENARSHAPLAALCNLAFLQTVACDPFGTNGALWTLYNEFWYYILWVAMLVLVMTRGLKLQTRVILMAVIIAIATASPLQREGSPILPYFMIWAMGAWAAVSRRSITLHPILLVTVCVLLLLGFRVGMGLGYWNTGGIGGYVFDLISMGVFATFLCRLRFVPVALPDWISRPSVVLAGFSFTLYCLHVPLMNVMAAVSERQWGWGWRDVGYGVDWLRLAFQLGIVIVFSYVVSRVTEAQTERLRKLRL